MARFHFFLLAALNFVGECTDIPQECNALTCKENIFPEGDNCTLPEEEETLVAEAIYSAPQNFTYPAPKTGNLGSDIGKPQNLDATYSDHIFRRVEQAREYVQTKVMVDEKYSGMRDNCKNKHEDCAFWSVLGECENNPGYMKVNCGPVCESCEVRILVGGCHPLSVQSLEDTNYLFK